MSSNNPYGRSAILYDLNVSLPVIAAIRRQEARAVANVIARYADGARRVLEIGPGTGFYTMLLARTFPEVVAVEESSAMTGILREKLAVAGAANVTVVNSDFQSLSLDGEFDMAVAIGVLDYVAEPRSFVARMCAAARRAVVVTAPQRSFWGSCFAAGGRLRSTRVYCHEPAAPPSWAPRWRCTVEEVGLRTRLTRGLTLVAAFERPSSRPWPPA
jgi:SAM-dependent methyltransferase